MYAKGVLWKVERMICVWYCVIMQYWYFILTQSKALNEKLANVTNRCFRCECTTAKNTVWKRVNVKLLRLISKMSYCGPKIYLDTSVTHKNIWIQYIILDDNRYQNSNILSVTAMLHCCHCFNSKECPVIISNIKIRFKAWF